MALLQLGAGGPSGLALDEPYPDWRGFTRVVIPVGAQADAPREMMVRIYDRWHDGEFEDRFNRMISIHPGIQEVAIDLKDIAGSPATRGLDLSQIRSLEMYAYDLTQPARIRVGRIRLE
jgi:hypothetical protein